jgi:hypothetical protein
MFCANARNFCSYIIPKLLLPFAMCWSLSPAACFPALSTSDTVFAEDSRSTRPFDPIGLALLDLFDAFFAVNPLYPFACSVKALRCSTPRLCYVSP